MITTIFSCDRPGCGHTQEDSTQMWELQVSLSHYPGTFDYPTTKKQALWCRKCVEEFGMLPIPETSITVPIIPPPTIEDLVREIVRSEKS